MTDKLDALPESVRSEIKALADFIVPGDASVAFHCIMRRIQTIIARVQELERENGELRAMRDGWRTVTYQGKDCVAAARVEIDALRERAERAEAKLAAVEKRIAEAKRVMLGMYPAHGFGYVQIICEPAKGIGGETFALLPLDNEAKS